MLDDSSCLLGLFTDEVCTEMGRLNDKPIIFPMSNPLSKAECTAKLAFTCTQGRAIFASGSPFEDVVLEDGKLCHSNQANNMFIFPGLGLGAVLGKCKTIPDSMMMATAEALADYISDSDVAVGKVYPDVSEIRKVSKEIAVAVIESAKAEKNCDKKFLTWSSDDISNFVESEMYQPRYAPLVYREPGKGE